MEPEALAAILTGAYMTRQVYLIFFGNERFHAAVTAAGHSRLLAKLMAEIRIGRA